MLLHVKMQNNLRAIVHLRGKVLLIACTFGRVGMAVLDMLDAPHTSKVLELRIVLIYVLCAVFIVLVLDGVDIGALIVTMEAP